MSQFNLKVVTHVIPEGIEQIVHSGAETLSREVMRLKELGVREALQKLGWRPPNELLQQEALLRELLQQSRRVRSYSNPDYMFDAVPVRAIFTELDKLENGVRNVPT